MSVCSFSFSLSEDHDAAVMHGDGGIDQVAPERPQSRQCAILIGAGQPAVPDHISRQDRRKFPGFGHDGPSVTIQISTKLRSELARLY